MSPRMKITREIGKKAQRSALGYLAIAYALTIPMGLVATLLAGWPLLVLAFVAHIFPAAFVWATADHFYFTIVRSPLWGMLFSMATLIIGACGFCLGLMLLGHYTEFIPFSLLPGLKISLSLASIFILPALFLGALLSLRFQDIHKSAANKPEAATAGDTRN